MLGSLPGYPQDPRRPAVLQIRVRAVAWDDTLGGLHFDAVVADLIAKKAPRASTP